jgi:hypothetical protein
MEIKMDCSGFTDGLEAVGFEVCPGCAGFVDV